MVLALNLGLWITSVLIFLYTVRLVIQVYALTGNAEEAEVDGSMKTYKTF